MKITYISFLTYFECTFISFAYTPVQIRSAIPFKMFFHEVELAKIVGCVSAQLDSTCHVGPVLTGLDPANVYQNIKSKNICQKKKAQKT